MTSTAYPATDESSSSGTNSLNGIETIRRIVKEIIPEALECINYQMPGFEYKGRLFCYAEFANHLSILHPFSEEFWDEFRSQLGNYETSSLVIQVPAERPFPEQLMREMVAFRKRENEVVGS